jgi:hypothetical protein
MADVGTGATVALSHIAVLPGLSAGTYVRHSLHGQDVAWIDKNCYSDLWIELLHALKLEPSALFAFTLAMDFEGDQWTFFKPPLEELRDLYGVNVQELTVWRPLIEHAVEHLGNGKLISTEADAYWLPDTSGTDYKIKHSKTTILLVNLDVEAQRLGYFHNAGYFELSGEDFRGLFRLDIKPDAESEFLPLFAELVHLDRLVRRPEAELAALSLKLLRQHFERRPQTNPFVRFGQRIAQDFTQMHRGSLIRYHAWAFASTRQAGSAFELAAANLRWQAELGNTCLSGPADCFDAISQGNKALILKGARAVNSGRPLDAGPLILEMAQAWDRGMELLSQCLSLPA